jgi:hypothetical protein
VESTINKRYAELSSVIFTCKILEAGGITNCTRAVWMQLGDVLLHVFDHRTLSLRDLLKEEEEVRFVRRNSRPTSSTGSFHPTSACFSLPQWHSRVRPVGSRGGAK